MTTRDQLELSTEKNRSKVLALLVKIYPESIACKEVIKQTDCGS